jgi:hypothetical protein
MIVNILQMSLTFLTAVILYLTLVRSLRTWKENKAVDVMLRCQERYDDIVWNYKQKVRNSGIDELEFYERFWELQVEQFQYWRKGYISDEIYECWAYQRHREWLENKNLRSLSYQDGWKKICGLEVQNVFTQFMNLVFSGNISEAMKKYKAS